MIIHQVKENQLIVLHATDSTLAINLNRLISAILWLAWASNSKYSVNSMNTKIAYLAASLLSLLGFVNSVEAQCRTKTTRDSINSEYNGYYYHSNKNQFEVSYPTITSLPPQVNGMPSQISEAYMLADSLMRTLSFVDYWTQFENRWLHDSASNDTVKSALKYYYLLDNYDPGLLMQYGFNQSKSYKMSYNTLRGSLLRLFSNYINSAPDAWALGTTMSSDYILKVKVLRLDSVPRVEYGRGTTVPGAWTYKIYARVLDTIKGKSFQPDSLSSSVSKESNDSRIIDRSPPIISFTYVTAAYESGNGDDFRVNPALHDAVGKLRMRIDSVYAVFLVMGSGKWDKDYDWFCRDLTCVFPVVNDKLLDYSKVWSSSPTMLYSSWRAEMDTRINRLLSGGF